MTIKKNPVMSFSDTIIYYLLTFIGLTLILVFGLWWFGPEHIPHNFAGNYHLIDVFLFSALSYVVWFQIGTGLFCWYIAYFIRHPEYVAPESNLKVAFLTAFVPGKEPYEVLENTLRAIAAIEYPHDTWLLDEGDTDEAKEICRRYGVKHYSRKGIAKYNTETGTYKMKTKAGNYNSWYDQHSKEYEFVAQIDVDFVPKKNFLTRTLGYFRDPEIAFVGSPQIYGNTNDSWIAQGAAEQAYGFYGSMQKGFFGLDMQLFIGANHVMRVSAHNSIGGYSGHIVEDHLTGMRLYANKWKSVYVPEVLAIGEGPSTWDAYFSQQMRWAYGLIDILFYQSPKQFKKMRLVHAFNYFALQQYYFYGLTQVVAITLLTMYFVFGIQSTSMKFWELIMTYPSVLLIQEVCFLWLQRFNINPKKESGLMLHAVLLNIAAWPIYFIALIEVLLRKKLTYMVTPKGTGQIKAGVDLKLFLPHFVMGTITFFDVYVSFFTHNQAATLLFWAMLNTLLMYYFVFSVSFYDILLFVKKNQPKSIAVSLFK